MRGRDCFVVLRPPRNDRRCKWVSGQLYIGAAGLHATFTTKVSFVHGHCEENHGSAIAAMV